ncbi:cation:dicarboxylase symporter family transporter [Anaerococcus sp. AGMB09787]|uniref:dicarboxylate/amino acid:cation symporter n=1 Tax=Anaerococcus sp. AGMB09787 TaxID=2922869 RepID=UPI001FAFFB8B|nr:cation:dicarboxylase symporter family transporter [Anaerococcus sp. AGMB09787]
MKILKENKSSIILLLSILLGWLVGIGFGEKASLLKPLADLFLNLLFVSIVPMVAISIISSLASMGSTKTLAKILIVMFITFIITGIIAGVYMLVVTGIFDPSKGANISFDQTVDVGQTNLDILAMFTVDDLYKLLSKENLMALIVISIITGLALASVRDEAKGIIDIFNQLMVLINKIISYIMKLAPIGIGAYFATFIGEYGSSIVGPLARTILIFFVAGFVYFFLMNTIQAFLGGGMSGIKKFWKHTWPAFFTAFSTSSSAAALPVNLIAGKRAGVRDDINNLVIPLGANLHKDGTVMIQIIKISLLCGIFDIDLTIKGMLLAILVSFIAATVAGAVPGGGYTAEILLVSTFSLPQETIPIMVLIATVVDSIATGINTTTDLSQAMLIERLVNLKDNN